MKDEYLSRLSKLNQDLMRELNELDPMLVESRNAIDNFRKTFNQQRR